jgi:hypothetical protein
MNGPVSRAAQLARRWHLGVLLVAAIGLLARCAVAAPAHAAATPVPSPTTDLSQPLNPPCLYDNDGQWIVIEPPGGPPPTATALPTQPPAPPSPTGTYIPPPPTLPPPTATAIESCQFPPGSPFNAPTGSPTPTPTGDGNGGGSGGSTCNGTTIPLPWPIGSKCIPWKDWALDWFKSLLNQFFLWLADRILDILQQVFSWVGGILTATPDMSALAGGLSGLYQSMYTLALVLYGGFLTLATMRYFLASLGRSSPYLAIGALRRAVVGMVLLLALNGLAHTWFSLVNDVATAISGAPGSSTIGALDQGLASLLEATIAAATLDWGLLLALCLLALVAIVLVVAIVAMRLVGLFILASLYAVSPACLVSWVSPDFAPIARWWAASFVAYSLWGVAYAVVLKVDLILLTSPSLPGMSPGDQAGQAIFTVLLALAGLLTLWRVPAIMDSLLGGILAGLGGAGGALAESAGTGGVARTALIAGRETRLRLELAYRRHLARPGAPPPPPRSAP